jgi:hypothetical protein
MIDFSNRSGLTPASASFRSIQRELDRYLPIRSAGRLTGQSDGTGVNQKLVFARNQEL